MTKSPYSPEFRAMVSQEYIDCLGSYESVAKKYKIGYSTLRRWVKTYQIHGNKAFIPTVGNRNYTAEFKSICVKEVLSGKGSVEDVVAENNISSTQVLRNWIEKYNANRELQDYCPKREVYMAEAKRKTTIEEREEIVQYCLDHGKDYINSATLFNVSYYQVYSWVRKFEANGAEGLVDKRGIHKSDDELSEIELLRRENKRLQRQLKEERMYNELLKKLRELERM